ncbi:murein biosynthesis integral membrane protein MurJ [Rudaeicoccus suwonensis]|uniref:Putative peptidoglycan lipid II flippase n=1 Tax=Rudaeicoccus suwonensis TaxID=657409 RepID=A0A561E3Z7_9MICO|nr:murein biosynthesis integral membrane protein MurJ [Rudaeicoccus suwonensis]TWE10328.1 putative peptidoglycan lipid II flippase [Rudaeicoccus suwonensis]
MSDRERHTLGELYAEAAAPRRADTVAPESPGSLGQQYAAWIGEDSGYLPVADPAEIARRRAASAADAGSGNGPSPDAGDAAYGTAASLGAAYASTAHGSATRGVDGAVDPATSTPAADAALESGARGIGRASAIMAAGTMVSRLLGLVRTWLLIWLIGSTTIAGDAFATANQLPNMIYILLAGGVINVVLVPQITRALSHPDGGKAFTDRLLTLAMTILLGVTIVFTAASPLLFKLFSLSSSGETWRLGAIFTAICLPQIFFYGLYTLLGEVLNARSRFGAPMWSPVLANVFAIAGIIWLLMQTSGGRPVGAVDRWTMPMIVVLAGSATLGIVAQALALIPPLRRAGYRFTPNFTFRGVGLRTTSRIAVWAFLAVVVQQLGMLVSTNVLNKAGGTQAQAVAFLLFMLPHSLVTLSLITALFTRMSRAAHRGDTRAVVGDVRLSLRLSGVATIPATIGSLALVMPIVHTMWPAVDATAIGRQTIAMLLGLVPFTVCVIVQRVFYAYEDARTPFRMQVICTVIASVFTLVSFAVLSDPWVGSGVAFAQSLSYIIEAIIGFWWLRRMLGGVPVSDVVRAYSRLGVAAVAATVVAVAIELGVGQLIDTDHRVGALLSLLLGGAAFVVIYFGGARRMRVAEVEELVQQVTGRLGGLRRLTGR